ncbi:MAG: hypothetical protein JEY96_15660 [Bacteroidales bacterium]|nr:hypothetical protein [Bacteroidales bacterium]
MRVLKFLAIVVFLSFGALASFAQGGYEDLLFEEVEVENPVYMPVLGIGFGYINYYGELQNDFKILIQGQPTYRINLFQYIDKKHSWKLNANTMFNLGGEGNIVGYERNYNDTTKNANFQTSLFSIGFNVEYAFGNIFQGERKIRPFVSLGAEYIDLGNTKSDILDADGILYNYQTDGTIRVNGDIVTRDYEYETNFRDLESYYGRTDNKFEKSTFALVADLGLDFKVSNRVALRLASSLHYTWTDDLDGISSENTAGRIGDSKKDMFSYSYVSLNIDLFSEAKTKIIESYFADVTGDFDYSLIADSDNDQVLDLRDDCPGTPAGVAVNDTTGCPFDDDGDGIPNYIDKEQFSEKGAIVDEFGAELSPNKIRESLYQELDAVKRTEMYMMPIGMGWSKYTEMTNVEIPEKYKKLDSDGDAYISFDELLEAISKFFDFDSEFTTEDIYDLNNFFFAQ